MVNKKPFLKGCRGESIGPEKLCLSCGFFFCQHEDLREVFCKDTCFLVVSWFKVPGSGEIRPFHGLRQTQGFFGSIREGGFLKNPKNWGSMMITVLCGTGVRHYDGFLFRRAAPRRTSASSIAPFSEMQPITRPRNITRPDGAGSVCAELTVASAQNDPALSAQLTLRSRVIGCIPTPDGTAPSRRPNARMRQHPPPTPPPSVCSNSSPYLRGSVSQKKRISRLKDPGYGIIGQTYGL